MFWFCYRRCRTANTVRPSSDTHTGYRLIHDLACAESANADRYARWQTDRCTTTYVSDAPSKDAREKLPGARGNVRNAREDVQDARENLQDARENLPTSLGWWMNSTASGPAIVTCHADDRWDGVGARGSRVLGWCERAPLVSLCCAVLGRLDMRRSRSS